MNMTKKIAVLIFVLVTVFMLGSCAAKDTGTYVYIVRHAEKVVEPDIGPDPNLTDEGMQRAQLLADMLAAKNISRIHSSDYIRTRDTAKPLADKLGLEIEIYDPSDLEGLAAKIETAGGSHLVVGHSNTIRETVIALSSDGGTAVDDKEYDRLYSVHISENGKVKTELSRFGVKYQPTEK